MSTTTEDIAATAAGTLTCGACGTSRSKPAPGQWAPLWDAGWRWLGALGLFSCPACPPVVVVDEQGRHLRP
ncbi:hypothetical protein [Streptomyces heilongjiangensis]|uniref:Uncharacterized protein n=1 Tax=Streptomyces heilongjiangensis TaxID=945052 RepID=A0ABW1BHZ4_9ACTN|nr:hypothetical protein [Streptomyces heilongjiangensis]MDC2951054.1 hypothetical protein [Streptomyces heilongjiangensis]